MAGTARQNQGGQAGMQELDTLLHDADALTDPAARAMIRQIVQAMMEFHGAGLTAILDRLGKLGEVGLAAINDLARDELVGSLLVLYDLHPQDLPTRVQSALEQARPFLSSHGGSVELTEITDEGVVRLSLKTSGHGCPSTGAKLKASVEKAIYQRAPEVTAIHIEGEGGAAPAGSVGFVPVERLMASAAAAARFHLVKGASV